MGEPSHSFASGYIWSPIMRSSRGKLFVYFSILGAMCFVVFLLSNAHSSLKLLEGANEKCQQQQDSLSAQLQVVYEHKNRLEKSLQQEKSEHKLTKEDIGKQLQQAENKVQEDKEKERTLENQISQLKSINSELEETKKAEDASHKEQLQALQTQKDSEIKQLQEQITELLAEKEKLDQERGTFAWKLEQHMNEVTLCQLQQQQNNQKLAECTEELSKMKELPAHNLESKLEVLPDGVKKPISEVSVSPPSSREKLSALDRPHIIKSDNGGKGPEAAKEEPEKAKVVDLEDKQKQNASAADLEKRQLPAPFNDLNANRDNAKETLDNEIHGDLQKRQEADNFPQVQPPVNHNSAAERGEYVNGMEQLERPQYRGNDLKRENLDVPNLNDVKDAQVHDMMLKSPDGADPQHIPPLQEYAKKMHNYPANLVKDQAELPVGDKHYGDEDDDDQDGENEDDPMGEVQAGPVKGFREPDFDGQDANENKEAVMVAPK